MGRYLYVDELTDALANVTLAGMGDSTPQARILEAEIGRAEQMVDAYCGQTFTPLAQWTEIETGEMGATYRLRRAPVYDVLSLTVGADSASTGYTVTGSSLRLARADGRVALKSTYALSGVVGAAAAVPWGTSALGLSVTYRTSYAAVGDNIGTAAVLLTGLPRVAHASTDATYGYLDLPEPYALWKTATAVRAPMQVWKDGVDDSATWTMIADGSGSPRRLRCALASYASGSTYVVHYVPQAIGLATREQATAAVLQHRSYRDVAGSAGGIVSRSVGPFSESYGGAGSYQFAGQVDALTKAAQALCAPYVRAGIV